MAIRITGKQTYFDGIRNRTANVGECDCGQTVVLMDRYLGACDCPGCGQWYNLSGQELNDPSTWSAGSDW